MTVAMESRKRRGAAFGVRWAPWWMMNRASVVWVLKTKMLPPICGALFVLTLLVILQILVDRGIINRFVVPAPSDVFESVPKLFLHEGLLSRFYATFTETFAASVIAVALGVLLGWLLQRLPLVNAAFLSWIVVLAAAPLILLFPLFLVFFGRNSSTIVAMSVVSAIPPVILKSCEAFQTTRSVYLAVGRSFSLTARQIFWMIQFPAAVPTMFSGIRLGIVYALLTVVGVEYLISFGGLGDLIGDLSDRYETAAMYGAILFVVFVSSGLFAILAYVENLVRPRA